jgi:chromosome segregation ATPase
MKPLNSKERIKAFYKVTGLFLLCFVLAMLLGFSTMNANKVTDYALTKQLEKYEKDSDFQRNTFQPNIADATKYLQDMQNYKERNLNRADIATSIDVALKKIKSEWKVDETDQQYIMYKNITDIYFALESAYNDKFKLEEQLGQKENDVRSGSGDLQRVMERRDELVGENNRLKSEKDILLSNFEKNKNQADRLEKQLDVCRDSVRMFLDKYKACQQEMSKLKRK